MKLRPYQQKASARILEALPTKPCVLAFCTGGGKTVTTHSIINDWIKLNPTKRVLVLTHNQTVLRDNFTSDKDDFFEYTKEDSLKQAARAKVVVTIPATIRGKNLGKFGLLVFDEAHEFFEKAMVSEIRKSIGKHSLLLLTASHGQFSKDTYHKELYSVMEGLDDGYLANAKVEIVSTKWHFTDSDYTKSDDLNNKYKFSDTEVDHACRSVLRMLSKTEKVRSVGFKFFKTKVEAKVKTTKDTQVTTLPKTLIAAHGVAMADKLYEWFSKQFPGQISISYADNKSGINADQDAKELIDFKENKDKRLLIVVRRGILGFDCPEIEYVLDMTASRNVDRTTQLLGRVLRKAGDLKKHYFKIVPDYLENYTWYQMGAVVALWHPVNNEMWAGQTSQVPVLIKEKPRKPVKKSKGTKNTKRKTIRIEKAILDFSEYREVFRKSDASEHVWMRSERFTTLREVKHSSRNPITNKLAILSFIKNESRTPSYSSKCNEERRLGMLLASYLRSDLKFKEELQAAGYCTSPKDRLREKFQEIKDFLLKYNRRPTIRAGEVELTYKLDHLLKTSPEYTNKLLAFFPVLMGGQLGKSFVTMKSSLPSNVLWKEGQIWGGVSVKHKFIDTEFGEFEAAYHSLKHSWNNGLTGHPLRGAQASGKSKIKYTNKEIQAVALTFTERTAWCRGHPGTYSGAVKRGILDECCTHMSIIGGVPREVLCENTLKVYKTVTLTRVTYPAISQALRRGTKSKGHTFRYATEEEVTLAKKEGRFVE